MKSFLYKKERILCILCAFCIIEMTLTYNDDRTFFYENFINAHVLHRKKYIVASYNFSYTYNILYTCIYLSLLIFGGLLKTLQ